MFTAMLKAPGFLTRLANVKRSLFTGAVLLILGFVLGWQADEQIFAHKTSAHTFEIREGRGFHFTNPLLECEVGGNSVNEEILPFGFRVQEYVQTTLESGKGVDLVSVYFREMNSGVWFGINEMEEFSPASLLKVATMISCFKQAEADPAFLKLKVRYPEDDYDTNEWEVIKSSRFIKQGHSYSVEELVEYMVMNSDNNAMRLLLSVLDMNIQRDVYFDLGFAYPSIEAKLEDFMSVKVFASAFRVLYNSSYLTRSMSERALKILSRTDFREGIVAGVPAGIEIAHKFGERALGKYGEVKQLHDCGIVYYPGYPYMVCVMSRGGSYDQLDGIISDISRLIFEGVHQQRASRRTDLFEPSS